MKDKYHMSEKIKIKVKTGFDLDLIKIFDNQNLDQACENLKKFTHDAIKQIEPQQGKAEEIIFDVFIGYDDNYEVSICYHRTETDAEFQDRMLRQEKYRLKKEKRKQEKLEKDRKLYEQLKQKFEKG